MTSFTLAVTGARGFIGRHVVREGRERGWRVLEICRDGDGASFDLENADAEARLGDVLQGSDAVIHAAARVQHFGPRRHIIGSNVAMTSRVVRAAETAGVPALVLLSSASVLFEAKDQEGLREDAPLPKRWLSGYAESKAHSEALVHGFTGRGVILRPQAVIGPGDRSLLPPIVEAAKSGRWRWLGADRDPATELMSVGNLARYTCDAAANVGVAGVFHLSDGTRRSLRATLTEVFEALGIDPGTRELSQGAALRLASCMEGVLRVFAPRAEPPLTRFAVEVLTRTRTLDRRRTLEHLGPPYLPLSEGLRLAIEAAKRDGCPS